MSALNLDQNYFKAEVLDSKIPVLVDFWAEWCGPCRLIGPVVEELATEYDGKAVIAKVNVDVEGDIAGDYGIMSIPTLLFFKNGQLVDKHVGVAAKSELKKKLDALIG